MPFSYELVVAIYSKTLWFNELLPITALLITLNGNEYDFSGHIVDQDFSNMLKFLEHHSIGS